MDGTDSGLKPCWERSAGTLLLDPAARLRGGCGAEGLMRSGNTVVVTTKVGESRTRPTGS